MSKYQIADTKEGTKVAKFNSEYAKPQRHERVKSKLRISPRKRADLQI